MKRSKAEDKTLREETTNEAVQTRGSVGETTQKMVKVSNDHLKDERH